MTPAIEVTVNRDSEGTPSLVEVVKGSQKLTAVYDKTTGLKLSGSSRSWNSELLDILKLVFPYAQPPVFSIPQPLQVIQISSGDILLFDDMETLLKWYDGGLGGVALDNARAYNGSQSLRITCGAADVQRFAIRSFPVKLGKWTCSMKFFIEAFAGMDNLLFVLTRRYIDFTSTLQFRFTPVLNRWDLANAIGVFATIPNFGAIEPNYWHELKFSFIESILTGIEVDCQAVELNSPFNVAVSAAPFYATFGIYNTTSSVADSVVWFDDVLIRKET